MAKPAPDWTMDETAHEDAKSAKAPVEAPVEIVDPPKKEFTIVDHANYQLVKNDTIYPFDKVEIGQGFFVPLETGNTMDQLVVSTSKAANDYRLQNSEVERNNEGDEVWEDVTVKARKRKPDGTFELDGDGVPKLTVSSGLRPRLIGPMFMVKPVHKDDELSENNKSEADGVIIIRLD
jgi:hypothetical protein